VKVTAVTEDKGLYLLAVCVNSSLGIAGYLLSIARFNTISAVQNIEKSPDQARCRSGLYLRDIWG